MPNAQPPAFHRGPGYQQAQAPLPPGFQQGAGFQQGTGFPPGQGQAQGQGFQQGFARQQRNPRQGQGVDFEDSSESAVGGMGGVQCPPGYVRGIFRFLLTTMSMTMPTTPTMPRVTPPLCACSSGVVFYKFVFLIFHPFFVTHLLC